MKCLLKTPSVLQAYAMPQDIEASPDKDTHMVPLKYIQCDRPTIEFVRSIFECALFLSSKMCFRVKLMVGITAHTHRCTPLIFMWGLRQCLYTSQMACDIMSKCCYIHNSSNVVYLNRYIGPHAHVSSHKKPPSTCIVK